MNTAILLLALVPTQIGRGREEQPSNIHGINPRFEIGPRVQNREFRLLGFFRKLNIKGDNNIVILNYRPTASGIQYYSKNKRVNRIPLFRRFRRTYP